MNKEIKIGNNGCRAAYFLKEMGLLYDGIKYEEAAQMLRPYMVNERHLLMDNFCEDFLCTCEDDLHITPFR